jgi:hypothetical protein
MVKKTKEEPQEEAMARLEYMDAAALVPWSRNPKKHDFAQITSSIKRFGFTQPPLLDEDTQRLIAGHGRVECLLKLKAAGGERPKRVVSRMVDIDGVPTERWFVPVIRGLKFANEDEASAYLIADNRLTEIGGWDEPMLKEMLNELNDRGAELEGVGFDLKELEVLTTSMDEERLQGPTPKEKLDTYVNAPIKQIVIFLKSEEYDQTVARMNKAMEHLGVESHSEVLLRLLSALETQYEPEE